MTVVCTVLLQRGSFTHGDLGVRSSSSKSSTMVTIWNPCYTIVHQEPTENKGIDGNEGDVGTYLYHDNMLILEGIA